MQVGSHTHVSTPILGQTISDTEIEKIQDCFKQAMINAEKLFATLGTASIEEKDELAATLENAWSYLSDIRNLCMSPFQALESQSQDLARITFMWGECRWAAVDMEKTRQVFSLSLMHARNLGVGFETNDSFREYLTALQHNPHAFRRLEDELLSNPHVESIIREALAAGEHAALNLAKAAFKLGGTYQNHDSYQLNSSNSMFSSEEIIKLRLNTIYIAESIWKELGTAETHWSIINSQYNTGPARHNLTHRNSEGEIDPQGGIAIIKDVVIKIDEYESMYGESILTRQQRAQCFNMLALKNQDILPEAENYQNFVMAGEIAAQYADQGFNVFLARLFMNNRAAMAFKSVEEGTPFEGVDIEKIQGWINDVLEQCEKHKYSNFYDAIFTQTAAKVAFYQGNFEDFNRHLDKSIEICDSHLNNTKQIREDSVELLHNRASSLFESLKTGNAPAGTTIEFLQECINKVLEQGQTNIFSEFKNAIYYQTGAQIALFQGKIEESRRLITGSIAICKMVQPNIPKGLSKESLKKFIEEFESKRKSTLEEILSFSQMIGVVGN